MQQLTPSVIADSIKPYVVRWIQEAQLRTAASQQQSSSTAIHDIGGSLHTGTLRSDQAPQFLLRDGSRSLAGNLSVDGGVTIDGVDLSVHVADPDAHHARATGTAPITVAGQLVGIALGDGVESSGGSLRVKLPTHSGIYRDSTGIFLTPSTLDITTTNTVVAAGHTHAVSASSNPGAAAAILATSAQGSLFLDTNLLYVDAPNNRIGINRTPSAAALDVLTTADSDHTLRVKQKSGQTGRLWRVEDTSGNELIVLDSQGNLQSGSPGFYSGLTGWQITPQGNAEFNNVWVRGELHSSIFVMDEFHATGGTFFVATASSLENDAVMDSTTGDESVLSIRTTSGTGSGTVLDIRTTSGVGSGTQITTRSIENWIELTDPPSGHATTFQPGDIVRAKFFDGTNVYDWWMKINSHTDMTDYWRYHVQKMSGTDATMPAGTGIVSYGIRGDGRILMTSDLNYAPYIDIFTRGGDAPWTGNAGEIVPHVRLGRLDGVGVPGLSGIEQYGLVAGTDLSNANAAYLYATNLGVKLYQVPLTLNDGSNDTVKLEAGGRVRFGTNVANTATTGFDFDPATGNLTIGNASYPGTVSIYGSVTITNSIPVGNVSGLGSLATASSVDLVTQVTSKSLANLDGTANTKLGGIETGATVGAAWGSNLTGRPTELTDGRVSAGLNSSGYVVTKVLPGTAVGTPAGSGLYLGSDKLGYYSGSAWTLYFDNAGHMGLGGTSGARLGWDGTDLFGTDGSTVQWYARASTGKMYAGGGAVVLDVDGTKLRGGSSLWEQGTALEWYATPATKTTLYGRMGIARFNTGEDTTRLTMAVKQVGADPSDVIIETLNSAGTRVSGMWLTAGGLSVIGGVDANNILNIRSTA